MGWSQTFGNIVRTGGSVAKTVVDTATGIFEATGEQIESVIRDPAGAGVKTVETLTGILKALPQGPESRDQGSERPESGQASDELGALVAALLGRNGKKGGAGEPGGISTPTLLLLGGGALLAVVALTRRR